jgi:hypothetical protein
MTSIMVQGGLVVKGKGNGGGTVSVGSSHVIARERIMRVAVYIRKRLIFVDLTTQGE